MLSNNVKLRGSSLRAALVAAGVGLFAATGANATGVLVMEWDYTLDSGFTSFSPAGVFGSNSNTYLDNNSSPDCPALTGCGAGNSPSKLQWPNNDSGDSFIEVGQTNGHFVGTGLMTNGASQNTVLISHGNFPQVVGTAALDEATLTDVLILTPIQPNPPYDGSFSLTAPAITISINFKETRNADAGGNPTGSDHDIFVLDVAGAGFDATTQTINQIFPFMGALYTATIGLVDSMNDPALDFLSTAECKEAGLSGFDVDDGVANNNCIGLTTPENQQTDFTAQLSISGALLPMPEPSTLAVLGLGLLGIGVVRRRRSV